MKPVATKKTQVERTMVRYTGVRCIPGGRRGYTMDSWGYRRKETGSHQSVPFVSCSEIVVVVVVVVVNDVGSVNRLQSSLVPIWDQFDQRWINEDSGSPYQQNQNTMLQKRGVHLNYNLNRLNLLLRCLAKFKERSSPTEFPLVFVGFRASHWRCTGAHGF